MNFKFFSSLVLWVIFALLDPDPDSESGSGSTDPIESGSNPDPQPCDRTEASMQDVTVARLRVYKSTDSLPSPPSFRCNVLRESLSVDSQNIPCATLKGVVGNLCISLVETIIL
jgi:hypothetical protein